MLTKTELRKAVRQLKKQHTQEELKALSTVIMGKLLELPCIKEATTVMLYCSLPDEVYTMDMIHRLHEEGKKIVLPKVISDCEMELREYDGDADLEVGSFGIMEPCGKLFTDYEDIDVAVIPGMAFDKDGNRLGRGKGYYDRFLNAAGKRGVNEKCESGKGFNEKLENRKGNTYKIGICFPFQFVDAVPADEHDNRMDMVVCGQ